MIPQLKEERAHGSREYPYSQYYMRDIRHSFQIPVHWHDEVEIIYVEKGTLQVKIGDREYEGNAGDVFFVNSRELHLMGAEKPGVSYYTLLFPLTFISFQTVDELESELLAPLRNNQLLFPEVIEDVKVRQGMHPYLKRMTEINHYEQNEDIRKPDFVMQHLQTRILLLELVQYIYEEHLFVPAVSGRNHDLQRELLIYIQDHFREKITLTMLAEEFHLSEKYVSRYFVESFRLPFSNYVMHLRLKEARRLLETTELPVTDVAFQAGFANVSYFIRLFKETYGSSPQKYRRLEYRDSVGEKDARVSQK